MLTNIRKRNEGFTIVETLIVLAIAGLIILIVLLAVPALQRTSRNTNIKSDASALAGGVSEYESNNDGGTPLQAAWSGPDATTGVETIGVTGTAQASAKVQASDTVTVATAAATPTPPRTITSGTIIVEVGQTCSLVPSTRAIAIYYPVETSSGIVAPGTNDCIDT
jgi:prepilin-type N-terminal cleavage/methylation domain-containing protein